MTLYKKCYDFQNFYSVETHVKSAIIWNKLFVDIGRANISDLKLAGLAVTVAHSRSRDSRLGQLVTKLLVFVESRIRVQEGVDVVVEAVPGTDEGLKTRRGESAHRFVLRVQGFAEFRTGVHNGSERDAFALGAEEVVDLAVFGSFMMGGGRGEKQEEGEEADELHNGLVE
ncbi:hypothetical protein L596_021855 [Steinernema carpocapsae]|uniref:Uncharacterized protein n=1 Tax=Steinernema carpocapsae TaxID=34508 RepID=A0A4U5MK33_STECR|nr:hypothetical protein L596_021855 [Steinernema carpocapsae]